MLITIENKMKTQYAFRRNIISKITGCMEENTLNLCMKVWRAELYYLGLANLCYCLNMKVLQFFKGHNV